MQEGHLFLEGWPVRNSYSKGGIDGLKNSIVPYYSKFQLISNLAISVFGIVLEIFKADPCRNSMMRYWQQLQYYNFTLPMHFYSINEICPNFEVDQRYDHQLFIIWAKKGGSSWLTLEFLMTYPHCHLSHKSYSNTDRNRCCYCALVRIKTVFLLLLGSQGGSNIYQGLVSTMDLHNCLVMSRTWQVINIFLSCVTHRISIGIQGVILTFFELFFLNQLWSYQKSFIHIARQMQWISVGYGRLRQWELHFLSLSFQFLACYCLNGYLSEMQHLFPHAGSQYSVFHYQMGALSDWLAMNF